MKDAYGGIFNLVYLIVFLVIVFGVLALVVSYTKAFKMKNAVISAIEEFEGSGCIPKNGALNQNSNCIKKIKKKADKLAYDDVVTSCPTDYTLFDGLYCYKVEQGNGYIRVRVITQVNVEMPIVKKIFSFDIFRVEGDTRRIYYNG